MSICSPAQGVLAMQVASTVELLQRLSVAGSITEEDSNWLGKCGLSAKDVDTAKSVSLDSSLGQELWLAAESHAISLIRVKRYGPSPQAGTRDSYTSSAQLV